MHESQATKHHGINLPLSFCKGGKANTTAAVMAQSVAVDDLQFPAALVVGGVAAAQATQSLRHALHIVLAHAVVLAGVLESLDKNVPICSAAQMAQVDTDVETFRNRGRPGRGAAGGSPNRTLCEPAV